MDLSNSRSNESLRTLIPFTRESVFEYHDLYKLLINIAFVFARAQTSTYNVNGKLKLVEPFIQKLNAVLLTLGGNARLHEVEIVSREVLGDI